MSEADKDQEYANLLEAGRQWEHFKKANNYRMLEVKTCETCNHMDRGYEGERDCEHPDRFDSEKLGDWSMTVDHLTTCDKWESHQ